MTRRTLFASAASALLANPAAKAAGLIKPKVLRPGDLVGMITPSTMVADPDSLAMAAAMAKYFGLRARFGKGVGKRTSYEQSVQDRLADLHEMFRDPEIKGIFCIRGGYGAMQILDGINYDLIRHNPKILLGYSDITSLHVAIHQKTGLVTFHGPVAVSRFTSYTQENFRKALFETKPIGTVTNPQTADMRPPHPLRTVRPGKARGRLVAGNLSLIAALMGSPYEIDTRGKLLAIEDVGEQAYSVDRMLTHLRLAGKLDQAAGVIWGECSECGPSDYKPSFASPYTVGETVDNILKPLKVPVLSGLTFGHTSDQLTLPLGVMATLDADKGELTIEESALV